MKNLLLVCATALEIQPTLDFLTKHGTHDKHSYTYGHLKITVCITGAGMVNTAFELGRLESRHFDAAINAGVAGAFKHFKTGDVVNVIGDCFSELGAEDGQGFLKIDELGLGTQIRVPDNLVRSEILEHLPMAVGITVNTVHGNEKKIKKIIESHNPDIETMEGAAFFQVANAFKWKVRQVRAISNLVEKRNKDKWDLPLAISKLNEVLIATITQLSHQK